MSERAAYCRVYWSIIDDDKFATIYDDDHHLATWLRLLLAADQSWPASASLPAGVRKASVAALCTAGLVDVTGYRFRIHGLDAERERRAESGRIGGKASGVARTTVERPLNDRSQPVPVSRQPRQDETRQDETSRDENARDSDDLVNDYYRLTNRFPSQKVTPWLDRLSAEFGYAAASRKLAEQFAIDPSAQTILGRVEDELKADQHNAAKAAAAAEKSRLEAFATERNITPEQAAENRRLIAEVQKDWFGGKDVAS